MDGVLVNSLFSHLNNYKTSSNYALGSCCLDLFVKNVMELFENITAFFSLLCLPPYEQVIHEMNIPSIERRTLYSTKYVCHDCMLTKPREHYYANYY